MVARLLEVRSRFSVVFSVLLNWNVELSLRFAFIFFLTSQLNLISGENLSLKEMLSSHTPSTRLNCNCQHSIEQKILKLWSLFIPSKEWTLGFCRILKGSYSNKLAKQRAYELFTREAKTLQRSLSCILKPIFACKNFICVRLFVFFMLQTVLK